MFNQENDPKKFHFDQFLKSLFERNTIMQFGLKAKVEERVGT